MAQAMSFLRAPEAPSKWLTMLAVCLGLGMLMIDTFVVNVAFPSIGRDLNADLSTAEWTVSAYVLVLGILPLAMGRLGDIFGRRIVYLAGLIVFVASSAACGMAGSIGELVAARVFQGIGAAIMMPGTLAIVTAAFPPAQRGLAIGIWGGVSGLGLIAGPILGGLLVHGDSWRWIFFVNLPIGAVALLMALRFVPESRDPNAARSVDLAGAGLLAGGLALVMFGFTQANESGWASPLIVGCFAGGAGVLGLFVWVETRLAVPLVNLRLFRNGTFVMACANAFLFSAAVFGSQPYTSLFMQNYLGFSPLEGGLAFLPATALVATLMPLSGIIGQRLGPRLRLIIIAGSISVALSFVYLLWLEPESGYGDGMLPAFVLRGLGIGLVMSASSLAVMSAMPGNLAGLASGTLTMFRQIGTAFGVAIFGAIFIHHIEAELPARLDATGAGEQAQVTAAASHFAVAGEGPAREAARDEIVNGFIEIAVGGSVIALIAAGTAVFIRHGGAARATAPAPTEAQIAAVARQA